MLNFITKATSTVLSTIGGISIAGVVIAAITTTPSGIASGVAMAVGGVVGAVVTGVAHFVFG